MSTEIIDLVYVVAAILFIVGLKFLGSPATARKGNVISSIGMAIAVIATLFIKGLNFELIIGGFVFGKIFKGPKLTKISPNKTYSGMIGSFLLALSVGYVYFDFQKSVLGFEINVLLIRADLKPSYVFKASFSSNLTYYG